MSQKGFTPILILVGVLVIAAVATGAYYLGTRKAVDPDSSPTPIATSPPSPAQRGEQAPQPTLPPLPSPDPDEIAWITKTNSNCNVTFTIPPKKEPYYYPYNPTRSPSVTEDKGSGRSWIYEESGNNSSVIFKTPTEASGFVAGGVWIFCEDININQSVESWINSNEGTIKDKLNLWNKEVLQVRYEGGINESDYYIFKAKNKIYSVGKLSMSSTEFVKNTTEQIFNKLKFED